MQLPKLNWIELKNKIQGMHDAVVVKLAKATPQLSALELKDDFPDIFGQAYHIIYCNCYSFITSGDSTKFNEIFSSLFYSSLIANTQLQIKLNDMQTENSIIFSSEPIMDIIELSGYAKIYSELLAIPDIWNACKNVWDQYFKNGQNNIDVRIKYFVSLHEYKSNPFANTISRTLWRTNWKMDLEKILREKELINFIFSSFQKPLRKHNSALIRAICRNGSFIHVSASEVFILTYLKESPEAKGIDFKDSWGLLDSIAREKNNNEK